MPLSRLRFFRHRAHADAAQASKAAVERLRTAVAEWKRRFQHSEESLGKVKARAAALQQNLDRWRLRWTRERAARQEVLARLEGLERKLAGRERSLAAARRQNERLRAAVPSWPLVRHSLPLRLESARARGAQAEARERERHFAAASAAYARAIVDVASVSGEAPLARTTIQGLSWTVPVMRQGDEQPDSLWMRKQKFPYRAIVQTRELGMGGVMLDLGANTGRMSIPRAILGDVSAVYCAEPDPVNYVCLVRNVIDNGLGGLVMPDNLAVGDADGVATLRRARHSGGHRLVDGAGPDDGTTLAVPMRTVDAWLAGLGVEPDLVTFVKVDVQGWEAHVLDGAAGLLARRHLAWQMEVSPSLLQQAGTGMPGLFDRLRRHFSRFTDLSKEHPAPHGRPMEELSEALGYLAAAPHAQTDLLLFNT